MRVQFPRPSAIIPTSIHFLRPILDRHRTMPFTFRPATAAEADIIADFNCRLAHETENKTLPADIVYFGEISLSGRVRPVPHAGGRLKEAAKLGFLGAVVPPQGAAEAAGLAAREVAMLHELVHRIAPDGMPNEQDGAPHRAALSGAET